MGKIFTTVKYIFLGAKVSHLLKYKIKKKGGEKDSQLGKLQIIQINF